jgi:phospholipid transport system substrate-binding protein
MIKKIALLSTVLLVGCSTFSTDNTNSNPNKSSDLQQTTNSTTGIDTVTSKNNSQTTNTSVKSSNNREQPSKQKNTNSTPTALIAQDKNIKPSTNVSNKIPSTKITHTSTATNSDQSPLIMLDNSILTIQSILKKKTDEINSNPKELKIIIDKYLLPNVDTNKVAAMMLGPKWRTASDQQKNKFINQFLILLTNIYARNVAKVGAYEVTLNSLPTEAWKDKKYVQVTGNVINTDNQNNSGSNITVYIINSDNKWKIYDIAIEGISIMQNYQSQFRPISSMNDVIKGVEKVNARTKG